MNTAPQSLTPNQALQKLKHYCAYQERCHQEVAEKLYGYKLTTAEVNSCISTLIEENYLNEERFAKAYARGKFNMKQWGKVKIVYNLKLKKISAYCIKEALTEIDDDAYETVLRKALEQAVAKQKSEKNIFIKKRKITNSLMQQGFETQLINEHLKIIMK